MNAIDILGSLLGGGRPGASRTGGGGGAADILGDLLGGRSGSSGQRDSRTTQTVDPHAAAKELEEMLGVGKDSAPISRSSPSQPSSRPAPTPPAPPSSGRSGFPADIFGQRQRAEPRVSIAISKPAFPSQNDQAVLLIRSMINSAKVDGEISEEEQQSILSQVGDTSPETIQFLRAEFARPLNVVEFANSIPIGLEHKVYGIALMAIKLDSREEADYLRQLASLLRISPDECNQLHQQQNAPVLYQ